MIDKLFLLFGIVGLGLAPDPQAEPESGLVETSPQPTEVVEGDRDIYNRMTVPVTINGQGPFNFMVDTGAQATVVTHRLNERMNFRPLGSATLVGMASTAQVQVVEVDGLEFAARVFDNLEAPLLDSRDLGADGILGLDSLQDMRVILDFRDNHIEVADSSVLQGNRGYEIIVRARSRLGRLIITSAKIDGVTTSVILDTGAQASMGNLALRDKLRARRQAETITTDVNGEQIRGDLHFVRKLDLGRVSLANLSVSFADGPAFAALGLDKKPALILGMEDLRLFDRVAIDFATHKVLFDLPEGVSGGERVNPIWQATRL